MPDIDLDALDRLAADIAVIGVDEQRGPGRRRAHDRRTALHQRRIHPPERTELTGVGLGLTVVAVIEQAHESGKAERACHQHRLVVVFVGALADRVDEGGCGLKLLLGQLHLTREVMQMADEGRHDFAKSRIRRARELAQDCFCHVGLIFDDHLSSSAPFRLAAVIGADCT